MSLINEEFERYSTYVAYEKFKNKTFLITGSKGLLASALIRFLLFLNKKYDLNLYIYAVTRNPKSIPDYIEKNQPIFYVTFKDFDVNVYGRNIDYVIHTATPTSRLEFINNPIETFDIIYLGTKRVLDFANKQKVESVIYLSSVEIYGSPKVNKPVEEKDYFALDPNDIRNSYPLGKKVAEYMCNTYYKKYNTPVNIIRPSSVQGLFQSYTEDRIYNQILRCLVEKKDFIMKTKGETAKTLIYTMDAITGILTVLVSEKYGETYNLTDTNTFYMMKDIVEKLFSHFDPSLKLVFDLEDDTKTGYIAPLSYNLSTEKLHNLGWQPMTDFYKIYEVDLRRFKYGD